MRNMEQTGWEFPVKIQIVWRAFQIVTTFINHRDKQPRSWTPVRRFCQAQPPLFGRNTSSLPDFRSTGIIHAEGERVEHTVEELGHLCHLYLLLFSLVTSRVSQATGWQSQRGSRRRIPSTFYDPHRGTSVFSVSSKQQFVALSYFRDAINFDRREKSSANIFEAQNINSRMFLSCLRTISPREFWSDGKGQICVDRHTNKYPSAQQLRVSTDISSGGLSVAHMSPRADVGRGCGYSSQIQFR